MSTKKPASTKKPRVTMSKTIRLTQDELDHAGRLLPQYPECMSEADLLRQATLIGLYVLAAQATGQPAYGGYRPEELIALLKYRVLGAIDFLFKHDAFPILYQVPSSVVEDGGVSEVGETPSTQIIAAAALELNDLGTNLMDD
jgi:hypothetical protein